MAQRRKPKVKKLKFELTRSGVGGIGVIVFCLFLWMFLLGVWAGQTLLSPSNHTQFGGSKEVAKSASPKFIGADKKAIKRKTE